MPDTTPTARDLLIEAQALIAKPEAWTQGTGARDADGEPIAVEHDDAVSWCATGPDGRACDSMKRFRLGETYAELKTAALADRDLFDEAAPASDEGGQSDSLDCHCTD